MSNSNFKLNSHEKEIFTLSDIISISHFLFFLINNKEDESNIENLRAKHKLALDNSPFNTTKNLSKEERKAMGLPPNAYNERMWELTLDPSTGRPMPERVLELQQKLRLQRENSRGVGGDSNNPWVDRGPNNIGGRTRGIMFDPNDVGVLNGDGRL